MITLIKIYFFLFVIAAFYTPFFKEVWERKPQIEKAFSLEDSDYSIGSRTPVPPPVPSRQESYHIRSGSLEDGLV